MLSKINIHLNPFYPPICNINIISLLIFPNKIQNWNKSIKSIFNQYIESTKYDLGPGPGQD